MEPLIETGRDKRLNDKINHSITDVTFPRRLSSDFHSTVEGVAIEDLALFLKMCNDRYHNSNRPLLSDEVYDRLKDHLGALSPSTPVLFEVGAEPADTPYRRRVALPYWMGSLNKVKTDIELKKWTLKNPATQYVVSDKLDGVSALFVFQAPTPPCLYTRGNGAEGHDISSIIPSINGFGELPLHSDHLPPFVMRGELVISKSAFRRLIESCAVKNTGNARNTVAGIVNAKQRPLEILQSIDFVAYELIEIDGKTAPTPSVQLTTMRDILGVPMGVHHRHIPRNDMTYPTMAAHLNDRNTHGAYDIDGLVITVDESHPRNDKTMRGNPRYSIAFKMNRDEVTVVVNYVEWNLSKDGYLKPTVCFEPTTLGEVKIRKATGFNAKFIHGNAIGPGARITITRSGDVIPFITSVLEPAAEGGDMPTAFDYTWNPSGVDIRIVIHDEKERSGGDKIDTIDTADAVMVDGIPYKNKNETENKTPTRKMDGATLLKRKQFEYMVEKLDFKGIGKGMVRKLFDAGIDDLPKLLQVEWDDLVRLDGVQEKAAHNIHKAVMDARRSLTYERLMVASNIFGRGMGPKTAATLFHRFPDLATNRELMTRDDVKRIDGFNDKTASTFLNNLPTFQAYLTDHDLHRYCRYPPDNEPNHSHQSHHSHQSNQSHRLNTPDKHLNAHYHNNAHHQSDIFRDHVFVFSGPRNRQFIDRLSTLGATIETSMTLKVTHLVMDDPSVMSTKKKYALKHRIKIVRMDDPMFGDNG
jgi:NAD-dependent DNA ligase